MPLKVLTAGHAKALGVSNEATKAMGISGKVTALNYHGGVGQVASSGQWRIDRQTHGGNQANIQIQRNSVKNAPSTVALVLVPFRYRDDIQDNKNPAQRKKWEAELTKAIKTGLNLSARSHKVNSGVGTITKFEVKGDFTP